LSAFNTVRFPHSHVQISSTCSKAKQKKIAGITGGFAPPLPSAVHTLYLSPEAPKSLVVASEVRPDGQPQLVQSSKALHTEKVADVNSLIDELQQILKELPTENPKGSEDIYGMDTSIMWGSDGFEWMNGGPAGCGRGKSSVQATESDKKKFKRAVEIVKTLVDKEKE
jgi:hypothetical protein